MPRFSAFTPFGQLAFSARKSHGQLFFEEQVKAVGGDRNYTDDPGSLAMARLYANAMAYGRAKYVLERVVTQISPEKTLELLPALEREYGLIPDPNSTLADRRTELAVAAFIARGARKSNVDAIMAQLFGADFVRYITVGIDDAVVSIGAPTNFGVYDVPGTPRSVFRIDDPISRTEASVTVTAIFVGGLLRAPDVDQRLIVDTGDYGRVEAISVEAATLVGQQLTLTTTFQNAHVGGTLIATGRHPNLASSKRHNVFLMTAEASRENRKRRRLNRAAARLVRAVSTWSVTDGSGPFRVEVGQLDITTIGEVA